MASKWAKVPAGFNRMTEGTPLSVDTVAVESGVDVETVQAIADGYLQPIAVTAKVLYTLSKGLSRKISIRELLDYEAEFDTGQAPGKE